MMCKVALRKFGSFLLLFLLPVGQWGVAGEAPSPLAALEWFLGDEWHTSVPGETKNDTIEIRVRFRRAPDGKSIRYTIWQDRGTGRNATHSGTYWWHPVEQEIRLLDVDLHGNVTRATLTAAGDTLIQLNTFLRHDGTGDLQKVVITRDGPDVFHMRAYIRSDNQWQEAVVFHYRRTR